MDVKLVYFKSDGTKKDMPVTHDVSVIGRGTSCGLQVPLASVSREHCRITIADDQVTIEDLGSSNGTFRNGEQLSGPTAFEAGDQLAVGTIVFTLQINGEPEYVEPPLLDAPVSHKASEPTTPTATGDADAGSDDTDASGEIGDLIARATRAINDDSSVFDFDIDLDDED